MEFIIIIDQIIAAYPSIEPRVSWSVDVNPNLVDPYPSFAFNFLENYI